MAASILLLIVIFGLGSGSVMAIADVSRSYSISGGDSLAAGDLVSTTGTNDQVTLADSANGQRLVGIVLSATNSVLAIDPAGSSAKAQVALSGTVSVYVSTLNGDIHAGDVVAVSPLAGIGMKAEGTLRTIGVAQADFTSRSSGAKGYDVTDKSGKSKHVLIGSVPVVIAIGNGVAVATQTGVVGDLQALASTVVGRQVSVLQAVFSFFVAIIAISALIALVYSSIRSGIIAIGRNPLARDSIYRSLVAVMVMALLIVVVAVGIIYFILR